MDDRLTKALNDQVVLEFASSYAYQQMAAWADAKDLTGTAAWFASQAEEERQHALKFFQYVLDRDEEVTLTEIPAPKADFDDLVDVFETALAQEQHVTAAIGDLYSLAMDVRDPQSLPLLSWFLEEQVEEEASVRQILGELRMAGDDSSALLMLDRELPARRTAEE